MRSKHEKMDKYKRDLDYQMSHPDTFMEDAAEAWEKANEVDDSFIKSVTGKEPDYSGEVEFERILPYNPLPGDFGFNPSFGQKSGVYSSILNKFIDPATGLPIEE